jgi:hypothetical protein
MRIFESGTTSYWLNYFAESIKDVIESKQGKCKIQVSFTGNILFIRGYSIPSDSSHKICYTYYNNPKGRPIFNPYHSELPLVAVSEFPFGCSLEYKTPIYYGEYISRDLLKFTKSDLVHIDYKGEEDLSLQVTSIYPIKSVESCVLDIYDFDFKKFEEQLRGFDFKQEILEPYGDKPWLKNFKLSEYIIF